MAEKLITSQIKTSSMDAEEVLLFTVTDYLLERLIALV